MGHESCGAVRGAVEYTFKAEKGPIESLVLPILPAAVEAFRHNVEKPTEPIVASKTSAGETVTEEVVQKQKTATGVLKIIQSLDDVEDEEKSKKEKMDKVAADASKANVRNVVWNLEHKLLSKANMDHVKVVGAYYNLSGSVEWLDENQVKSH